MRTQSAVLIIGLLAALALGAAFRLGNVADIEFKADEAWTFELVRRCVAAGDGSWLGMPSSQNLHNPGLSLWVFYPLGYVFGVDDPTGLARGVQLLNVAAIVLLAVFAWRCVPAPRREAWLWAAALVSVNPLAVLFHRKIWPPCVLPIWLVGLIAAWWYRERRAGAFVWGLLAACVAQIHLAGFFHGAALVLWTLLFDRRRPAWRWWLLGLSVGSYPMLPWLDYLLATRHAVGTNAVEWGRLLELKYWTHWLTEPFGLGLKYALGPDFADFLAGPMLGGRPTYGVAVMHGLAALIGVGLLVTGLRRWWPDRKNWRAWFGGQSSSSALLLAAMLWGYGLLLTATRLPFYRQYLLLAFPLPALWGARLAGATNRGRWALTVLVIAQAGITAAFLSYVHVHGGTPQGDYGRSYAAQVAAGEVMTVP